MFKKKSKETIVLLAALALVICLTIGSTLTYLFDISGIVNNIFDRAVVTTEVDETLTEKDGVAVKENVRIKNTGNVKAYIRATFVVNWKNDKGEVYGRLQPVKDVDYELKLAQGWIEGGDGFYYWPDAVISDAEDGEKELCYTGTLISSCKTLNRPTDLPEGYYLSVEILGSGIQSKPDRAVEDAWPAVEVKDGALMAKQ